VDVNFQAKTYLFEDRVRLVATSFLGFLGLFVLELAVIHNLGDRGLGIGSNLNQVQIGFLSQADCNVNGNDADLFAVWANKSDLRDSDFVVCTGIADAELLHYLD